MRKRILSEKQRADKSLLKKLIILLVKKGVITNVELKEIK